MHHSATSRRRPRSLRPALAARAGPATPTRYTARASIEAVIALTFEVDPSVGPVVLTPPRALALFVASARLLSSAFAMAFSPTWTPAPLTG